MPANHPPTHPSNKNLPTRQKATFPYKFYCRIFNYNGGRVFAFRAGLGTLKYANIVWFVGIFNFE